MSSQGPLPYLSLCGVEIANAARTVAYLRAGLGANAGGTWEFGDGDLCSVLYRVDGGTCSSPNVYASPAADPAPWYDVAEPGSSTFLGFVPLTIEGYDAVSRRSVAPRLGGLGGGSFSRRHHDPRVWKIRGALISSSDSGAEFGLRWLKDVLQGTVCDGCGTCTLEVRLACPPDNCSDDDLGRWLSYSVALTDGPRVVDYADATGGCRVITEVEFTLVAGNPFLYKPVEPCMAATPIVVSTSCTDICTFLFGELPDAECCTVAPPERGVLGAIFTFTSVAGFGSLYLEAWEECPGSSGGPTEPALQLTLSEVPANSTVVVNCSQRTVRITDIDPDTGDPVTRDGFYLLDLPAGQAVDWVEIRDCDDLTCFCVRISQCSRGDVSVTIDTQLREE